MAKIIVFDASLTLAWVLKEKNYPNKVKQILDDMVGAKITPIAPTIWLYETINGLHSAILSSRINPKLSGSYLSTVLEVSPQLIDLEQIVYETFQIATDLRISVYDASYIALAKSQKCDFITGDEKLFRKISGKIGFVKTISQYSSN